MIQRLSLPHAIVAAVVVVLLLALGVVQVASESLSAQVAAPGSLPTRLSPSFGLRVYAWLDRVAPAPYVEATLAREALQRGDLVRAQHFAIRLPSSAIRDELLAQIALARGQQVLAMEYFFAAPDVEGMQHALRGIAARDPEEAYVREALFRERLMTLTTHPDAVADAYWLGGEFAAQRSWRTRSANDRALWERRALDAYKMALQLAPLNLRFALSVANQALSMGDLRAAQQAYHQAIDANPGAADAVAGEGLVALRNHDRAGARAALVRARGLDAQAPLVGELEQELR